MFAGTAVFSAYKWTSKLYPMLRWFTTIMVHTIPFFTDRNTIFTDGKVIFIFDFDTTFVVLSILLGIVPEGIYAASAKSSITIKAKSKTKKVKKIKKSQDGKISILDGPMMGPNPKEVGKPKPLKFNIDFDNYDLKFTDVPKDHPYYKGIVWAVENGIIKNEKREIKPGETIEMREFLMAFF